jgi:hypothetical protein
MPLAHRWLRLHRLPWRRYLLLPNLLLPNLLLSDLRLLHRWRIARRSSLLRQWRGGHGRFAIALRPFNLLLLLTDLLTTWSDYLTLRLHGLLLPLPGVSYFTLNWHRSHLPALPHWLRYHRLFNPLALPQTRL